MKEFGRKSNKVGLESIGIKQAESVLWNLTPAELVEEALKNGEGVLSDTGALMCDTGKFTGRSPKDRFVVKDAKTADSVWWGDINIPFDSEKFEPFAGENGKIPGREKNLRARCFCWC